MLPVAIKFLIRLTAVSTICFGSFSSGSAKAETLTDTAQKSIVYIFFDIVDPNTGAKSAIQGTGFVVSPQGHVLTASHLFRAWKAQRPVDKANNPIKATLRDKVGYVPESPLILNRINIGDPEQEDVALLKLPASSQAYPAAPICLRQAAAAKAGDPLMAFGFPQNQNFQPVTGVLGLQNAEGGRWAAASAFAEGMSGGPVYIGETVVGLVKGGLEGTNAVQWITPIGFADSLLRTASFTERCKTDGQETENTLRVQKTFSKKSDEVQVGCEQDNSVTIQYLFPAEASEIDCSAEWVDTSALKSKQGTCLVSGSIATATGNIRGRDKEFFNCKGGGHGWLRMSGTYKVPVQQ